MSDRLRIGISWVFVSLLLASGLAMRGARALHPAPARPRPKDPAEEAPSDQEESLPRPVDIRRSHEPGRGRAADSPFEAETLASLSNAALATQAPKMS